MSLVAPNRQGSVIALKGYQAGDFPLTEVWGAGRSQVRAEEFWLEMNFNLKPVTLPTVT